MRWRSPRTVGVPRLDPIVGDPDRAFGMLEMGRLTWAGLGVAGIGWALLLGETAVSALMFAKTGRPAPATFHADLFEIGKCVIGSGFGLAVVGALQSGFGTLNRFFGAVLTRSGRRDVGPVPAPVPVEPTVERPRPAAPSVSPASFQRRPYRMFPDGSVEVDTILGTRLFRSMTEAREFI